MTFAQMELKATDKGIYKDMEWPSPELYRHLVMMTSGEANILVKSVEEQCGYKTWSRLRANYTRRTIGRMMRQLKECMYPGTVKDLRSLAAAVGSWEEKWKKMMTELGADMKVPDLWRMAALLEICPKDVREQMHMRLDEVGESYDRLKEKILGWTANRVESERG